MSPAVESTIDRLDEARQRWWLLTLCCQVLLLVVVGVGLLVVFVLGDALIRFSQLGLIVLFLIWCMSVTLLLGCALYRILNARRSLTAAARRVESSFPELGSYLITLLQFAEDESEDPQGFRQAALTEALEHVQRVPFHRAADRQPRRDRWRYGLHTPLDVGELLVVLAVVVGIAYGLGFLLPQWSSSVARLLRPWQFVPQTGQVQILEVRPGNAVVPSGSPVDVTADIVPLAGRPPTATLFVSDAAGVETSYGMVPGEQGDEYSFRLPSVTAPIDYRLQIGDSQSSRFHLEVREKPLVTDVEVTYEYPEYLGIPSRTERQSHGDLAGPQFARAFVKFHANSLLSKGHVRLADERTIVGSVDRDGRTLAVSLPLLQSETYTLHLFNELGQSDAEPRENRIRVTADTPPTIQLLQPGVEVTAAVGQDVPFLVRAADDHGLNAVRLEWKWGGSKEQQSPTIHLFWRSQELGGVTATTVRHAARFPFADETNSPGRDPLPSSGSSGSGATSGIPVEAIPTNGVILVRAVAVDRRAVHRHDLDLEPQETASPWHTIRIISAAEQSSAEMAHLDGLQTRLWAILQNQLAARVLGGRLVDEPDLAANEQRISDIRLKQVQIQNDTSDLAKSIRAQDGEPDSSLKPALLKLANGEMLQAVKLADVLQQMNAGTAKPEQVTPLLSSQDTIIDALKKLLEVIRRATSAALAEMEQRPGGDLPDDVRQKLQDLKKKLDEFLDQQKRIIEATQNLAKKPVEDFTEQEEQLLQEMAAAEDDWSRFMEETHSDFSKLPEQDFSNPSLLEEMVEVQTELKMAADALTKKTADIAVPLEQLGAEMAEEMTTNIEKWLPDTPDRERWSQEEPLDDAMKEAPMAELPGELEDIVGELMEEEEDLFDEMEDVSSSWADSLDKGAGWDAMDGPISNMSARGVTGNRLPNSSEIGGRSGEGRQGQASGEFVSDTAVGKGGRKTPSRLSADPFVKGQVKDLSKDPVGGATGGGKESGAGGEGLEGPMADRPQRDMHRLATKQASLRNKAESIDLKFQVLAYHHTDLKRLQEVMAAVEHDLRSGRYQSALRRREVLLEGLQGLKTYLDGEFAVRQDQSSNLPAEIQKQLLGSMQEPSPAGWEELNRKYFDRLSNDDSASGKQAARPAELPSDTDSIRPGVQVP